MMGLGREEGRRKGGERRETKRWERVCGNTEQGSGRGKRGKGGEHDGGGLEGEERGKRR